ncbi:NifU family protein [Afifella pfennigii]|uniref:NifU family protein n=1 Tax=Afifella pfennigii TaxID=209897 RepID=UPI001AEC1D22|nr:NifU family protein [Afifella pfennigii]
MRAEKFRRVEAALAEIRPYLARDGGDCRLVDVQGNKVFIALTGACIGCQLASVTVGGIQMKLMARLGVPVRVVPVKAEG